MTLTPSMVYLAGIADSIVALLAAVFALLTALTPSTKTVAAMYVLPAVVNSEAVQKLPAEATGLAFDWIKGLREELKK